MALHCSVCGRLIPGNEWLEKYAVSRYVTCDECRLRQIANEDILSAEQLKQTLKKGLRAKKKR